MAQDMASRIDGAVAPYFQAEAPGATVIVVKDGKTVLRKAYGMADVQNGVVMTPDTVLRLGSITKQFTAVGILMLAEQGKLALGDSITQHLPDYPAQGKKITIKINGKITTEWTARPERDPDGRFVQERPARVRAG